MNYFQRRQQAKVKRQQQRAALTQERAQERLLQVDAQLRAFESAWKEARGSIVELFYVNGWVYIGRVKHKPNMKLPKGVVPFDGWVYGPLRMRLIQLPHWTAELQAEIHAKELDGPADDALD